MKTLTRWMMVAVVVTACGVPLQATPDTIDAVVRPPAEAATVGSIGPGETAIYLVMDDSLVPVRRDGADDYEGLVGLLLGGPTPAEEQGGMRSAIPPSTDLHGVSVTGNDVVVDLSRAFASFGGREEILAVAQVVLTLTSAGADRVSLELDARTTPILLPNGSLATDPVGFDDYSELING